MGENSTPPSSKKSLIILVTLLMLPILVIWLYTTRQTFKSILDNEKKNLSPASTAPSIFDQWNQFRQQLSTQIKDLKNLWPSSDTVYSKNQETSQANPPSIPPEKLESLKNELLKKAQEKGQ